MRKQSILTKTLLGLTVAATLVSSAAAATPAKTTCRQVWRQGAAWQQVCQWKTSCTGHGITVTPDTSDTTDSSQTPDTSAPSQTPDSSDTTETPETPVTPDDAAASSVSAYEQEVVDLVNEIRAEYGLSALTLNETLCDGARLKSQDMQQNNYFSHTSPTYGSPFAMMRTLGITYQAAAENIAMGQSTPQAVVTAWMNSEGHRANILSETYTQIGVGYVASGNYWTQWFIA